jgi:SAM-dependent methyltransferase
VDGVDRSPAMIEAARSRVPSNATLHLADALTAELPDGTYDAVLSSSLLHHLDLQEALPRMARWLRPGGVLAAVAPPRIDLPRELPVELGAIACHQALGVAFASLRPLTGRNLFHQEATHDAMPVQDPVLTLRQVREAAEHLLPGVRLRRYVFWRYLLTWRKPL